MQEKEWQRRLVIGIVVAALFFGWWLRGFLHNWRFQLFSIKSWGYVAHEFEEGWEPSSTSDWIFLLTLLFAVPVFLYLWYLCTKVRWRRLVKRIYQAIKDFFAMLFGKKRKTRKVQVLAPPPPVVVVNQTGGNARPRPISYSVQTAGGGVIPVVVKEEAGPVFAKSATSGESFSNETGAWNQNDFGDDFKNMPLDSIELPEKSDAVEEDIPALFSAAGYQLISNVKTSFQNLDFLAVGADRIYAVLIDKEPGDWLAEEEPFNGEAPLWFSEVDHRVSPIYDLKQSAQELKSKIETQWPDIEVVPFMIEAKGNIINAEEMLKVWREMDVRVARTDIGGTEDLLVTSAVVEETQPASAAEIEGIAGLCKGGE